MKPELFLLFFVFFVVVYKTNGFFKSAVWFSTNNCTFTSVVVPLVEYVSETGAKKSHSESQFKNYNYSCGHKKGRLCENTS